MSDRDERRLRRMLFGEGEFERSGAPEPELLAELAELLPAEGLEAAVGALSGIGVIDRDSRQRALGRLLAALPRSAWGLEALSLERHPDLLRYLPDDLLPRMMEQVERLEPDSPERADAVLELGRRLRDRRARELLRSEALRWAAKPNRYASQDQRLLDLIVAQRGPLEAAELETLLIGTRAIASPRRRCRALAELARQGPAADREGLLAEALDQARRAEPEERAAALAGVVPALPTPRRREVVDEAVAAARAAGTADRTVLELALLCDSARRKRLVADLVGRYQDDGTLWPSATERIAELAAAVVRESRVENAQAMREIVEGLEVRDRSVWILAPYLSPKQFEDVLPEMTEQLFWPDPETSLAELATQLPPKVLDRLARRVQRAPASEGQRARVLGELAPWLSKRQVRRTAKAARDFEEGWTRHRLQSRLARHVEPDLLGELAPRDSEVSRERLRELFDRLPEERRRVVTEELIDGVWDRHGGSGPPKMEEDASGAEESGAEYEAEETGPRERPSIESDGEQSMRGGSPREEGPFRGGGDDPQADDQLPGDERGSLPTDGGRERSNRLHYVNRGFALRQHPDVEADPYLPLDPDPEHYFWLEIADRRLRGDAGRSAAVVAADLLPEEATLVVAVFGFPGEIGIVAGQDVGRLRVRDDGAVAVAQRVAEPELDDPSLLERRLFFPVTLPADRDRASLRCNLYCSGVLVQSHLVTVRLAQAGGVEVDGDVERGGISPEIADLLRDAGEAPDELGIDARVDYTLSHSLRAGPLNLFEPHALSVMLNSNGDGSHSFRFYGDPGADPFKEEATIGGQTLDTALETSRAAMRMAAWGQETPWTESSSFRYGKKVDLDTLTTDLARLAKAGRRLYAAMIKQLAAGDTRNAAEIRERRRKLRKMMATTGLVQVASKVSAAELIPAAILHDHTIDTANRKSSDFGLCPLVREALDRGTSVLDTDCFRGACPSARDEKVVCPSGFWGYRHRIGMPLSLPETGDTVAVEIDYADAPRLTIATWTGKDFESRPEHEKALRALHPGWTWDRAITGEELEKLLLASPHLLYFYCHGGLSQGGVPYLKIGTDQKSFKIDLTLVEDLAESHDLFWEDPRPLIFLNGCHTTALKPGDAFNLVMPFVETANAAGVIGTEITIFEPLAVRFAEEFLRLFLDGVSLGEAVRLSRIKLLEDRNPLGLVYIPFALAGLTMRPAAPADAGG